MVEAGRADGAIAAFQAALRLNPGMQRAKDGLAGAQAIQAQELAVAAKWSRQAEGAKADWSVYYNLGMAETRSAHFDAASRAFARASQLNRQSGAPHSGMALMHYIHEDYAAASAEIDKAKALGTEPPRDLLAAVQRKAAQR
jgi:Tfp pilus assembly protein PilF